MYLKSKTTNLHVEASSFCNARCPGCPRNAHGYPLKDFFKETNISIPQWKQILKDFPNVREINFCGNHGDPMMNPYIAEMVHLSGAKCQIATNGSIGLFKTFETLASLKCEITFGIDGLEDTNHLYRQGVKWNNLMDRVKHFIDAGGVARWQFIPFKHNQHQIDTARQLSVELGFRDFFTLDSGRDHFPAIQPDRSISHWILPAHSEHRPDEEFDVDAYIDMRHNPYDLQKERMGAVDVDCEHLSGSVYVNAEGEYFSCCYHGFGHVDKPKVLLEDFEKIKETWSTNCNEICAFSCGKKI